VLSLSSIYDSILQWSHYADYHRGICLKFEISKDCNFFSTTLIVSYKSLMQHYNHLVHSDKIVEYLIQPKYKDWSYESEVRIVKKKHSIQDNSAKGCLFEFNKFALVEIIFGVHASNETIMKYKDLCAKNDLSHVNFYKMELGRKRLIMFLIIILLLDQMEVN
jgi:hypothetical protein